MGAMLPRRLGHVWTRVKKWAKGNGNRGRRSVRPAHTRWPLCLPRLSVFSIVFLNKKENKKGFCAGGRRLSPAFSGPPVVAIADYRHVIIFLKKDRYRLSFFLCTHLDVIFASQKRTVFGGRPAGMSPQDPDPARPRRNRSRPCPHMPSPNTMPRFFCAPTKKKESRVLGRVSVSEDGPTSPTLASPVRPTRTCVQKNPEVKKHVGLLRRFFFFCGSLPFSSPLFFPAIPVFASVPD